MIDLMILEVWEHYRNYEMCELLTNMTKVIRSKRYDLKGCIEYIDKKLNFPSQLPFPSNTFSSGFHFSTQIPISHTVLSGRSYKSDDFSASNDRCFPKQKTGVFKKKSQKNS